jgi:hypothetical protein
MAITKNDKINLKCKTAVLTVNKKGSKHGAVMAGKAKKSKRK